MSVVDIVRNAALSVTQGYWQIIELYNSQNSPGEFVVFAMTQKSQLQKLTISVPRYMYVNCRDSKPEDLVRSMGGRKVTRELPHGHAIGNAGLYEVKLSEKRFSRNEKTVNDLINSHSVEGVYETLTPLWLRAVLQIGCIARVSNDRRSDKSANNQYDLGDLEFVSTNDFPYLTPKTAEYRKIYLYSIMERSSRTNQLGGIGLFFVDEDENNHIVSGKAFVWLINTGLSLSALHHQAKPPMSRLYKKYSHHKHQTQQGMKFATMYVNSRERAWQLCTEKIDGYAREKHGPTVVFAQGSVGDSSPNTWRKLCPSLNDMPVVLLPHSTTDEYFPLTWQMFVAERMIQRLFIFPAWLEDRLQAARYCHTPLSNLGRDATMTMIDVLLARQLHVSVIVLLLYGRPSVYSCQILYVEQ